MSTAINAIFLHNTNTDLSREVNCSYCCFIVFVVAHQHASQAKSAINIFFSLVHGLSSPDPLGESYHVEYIATLQSCVEVPHLLLPLCFVCHHCSSWIINVLLWYLCAPLPDPCQFPLFPFKFKLSQPLYPVCGILIQMSCSKFLLLHNQYNLSHPHLSYTGVRWSRQ